MDTFFTYIIVGFVCFIIGWKAKEAYTINAIRRTVQLLNKQTEEELKSRIVDVKIENHSGEFFIYAAKDGSYLAHANDKTSLENILKEKFPGKVFNASQEDLEKLAQ